jgi:hypothetical protein
LSLRAPTYRGVAIPLAKFQMPILSSILDKVGTKL